MTSAQGDIHGLGIRKDVGVVVNDRIFSQRKKGPDQNSEINPASSVES